MRVGASDVELFYFYPGHRGAANGGRLNKKRNHKVVYNRRTAYPSARDDKTVDPF